MCLLTILKLILLRFAYLLKIAFSLHLKVSRMLGQIMCSLYVLWSLQNWPNPTKPAPVNLSITLSHSHILNTLLPQTSEFICQVYSIWCLILWLLDSLTPPLFLRHELWQGCLNKCSYHYCLTQPKQTKLHHETLGSDLHWERHIPGRNNNSRGRRKH